MQLSFAYLAQHVRFITHDTAGVHSEFNTAVAFILNFPDPVIQDFCPRSARGHQGGKF